MDRVLAPQPRENPMLQIDVTVCLVVGKCVVQRDIEHDFLPECMRRGRLLLYGFGVMRSSRRTCCLIPLLYLCSKRASRGEVGDRFR